ncbi:hypothetical protein FQZ97_1073660 [compost metagenome]
MLPRISSNVSVHPTEPYGDPMGDWLESLERIKTTVPDDVLVLPAHDDPFRNLHARLDRLLGSHRRALGRLHKLLEEGPKRVVDLFSVLFARRIDAEVLLLATGETQANLNYLVQRDKATVSDDADGVAWYQTTPRS